MTLMEANSPAAFGDTGVRRHFRGVRETTAPQLAGELLGPTWCRSRRLRFSVLIRKTR